MLNIRLMARKVSLGVFGHLSRCVVDILDALSYGLSTLQTLETHISWLDQEKLGNELNKGRKKKVNINDLVYIHALNNMIDKVA